MKAKILNIDPLKESRAEKSFRRIYFIMEDGTWAKTDIVPAYRNFKTWKPIIQMFEQGAEVFLDGVKFRSENEIDADSVVRLTTGFIIQKTKQGVISQEKLI